MSFADFKIHVHVEFQMVHLMVPDKIASGPGSLLTSLLRVAAAFADVHGWWIR